jgi:hypothetical protein
VQLAATAATSSSAWDQPGTLGFIVVFGMGVILFFVFRSLAKHLRKINEAARLEALQPEANAAGAAAVGAGAAAGAGAVGADFVQVDGVQVDGVQVDGVQVDGP